MTQEVHEEKVTTSVKNTEELWELMMERNHWTSETHIQATGKMKFKAEIDSYCVREGEKVRVVMASRFGDLGVSRKLSKHYGYGIRLLAKTDFLHDVELIKVNYTNRSLRRRFEEE